MLLRNSDYDTLLHTASVASTEERNVQVADSDTGKGTARSAEASEAEEALRRAIDLAPTRIEPYQQLLEVYQDDKIFTPTESRRWLELWQAHGRELSGNAQYGRLCYDAGILYLCYYDYLGLKDLGSLDSAEISTASGQGAVQNASRSTEWFARAKRAAMADPSGHAGLQVDENVDELAALDVYETIGEFPDEFTTAGFEGRDVTEESGRFWEALKTVSVGGDGAEPVVLHSTRMVQLRLYQVAFESIRSSTYLTGFRQAGVTAADALGLLENIHERLDDQEFRAYVETNPAATKPLYDEIMNGYDAAVANVNRTYNSPATRVRPTEEAGE